MEVSVKFISNLQLKEIFQINTKFAHEHGHGKVASFNLHKTCNYVKFLSCKGSQREGFVSMVTIYFDSTEFL